MIKILVKFTHSGDQRGEIELQLREMPAIALTDYIKRVLIDMGYPDNAHPYTYKIL